MSIPFGLTMPPSMSETAMIFAPASWHMRAAIEPTLPKPWTTIRLPASVKPRSGAASRQMSISPRPVLPPLAGGSSGCVCLFRFPVGPFGGSSA